MKTSLYIHIPFCKRKCLYCDFYSQSYDAGTASAYIDVIISQIKGLGRNFSTVYIGGGTPSVLEPKVLERFLMVLKPGLRGGCEFTVEANPESLDESRIKLLLDFGVNRLSIGVQSLDDRKLKRLGRLHNAGKARESVHLAAKLGFSNISADLIFGVWGEDPEDWKSEVEEAVRLPVKHVSCYSLTYEKGTPLFDALRNKSVTPIEDDEASAMYEIAIDMLALGGFKQYEVSSFAAEGFRCAHNLSYWENNPYVGLGAAAVSYIGGVRAKNVASVEEYIKRHERGESLIESNEKLSPERSARETAAVKIRTKDGIDFGWFKEKTGYDFTKLERKALPGLLENGLIKYKREGGAVTGIALKRRGFLLCDTVSAALL